MVDTLEIIRGSPLDEDDYYKAATLGWCVELVRSLDDRFLEIIDIIQ